MLDLARYPLESIAEQVGTPYYLYDGGVLRDTLALFARLVDTPGLAGRYAMKANSAGRVLKCVREAGLWIDAVSGNEVLRARRAGFPGGLEPPAILLTADLFRDNAIAVVLEHSVLPNLGSPGMIRDLSNAGYRGPTAIRINPGFGHGDVEACDTGGPSSKHGIWPDLLADVRRLTVEARLTVVELHAHVGTGAEPREFDSNFRKLIDFFVELLPQFPQVDAVNLGGGLPHPYRPGVPATELASYRPVLDEAVTRLTSAATHPVRVEIEPGRRIVAGMGVLVARVRDVKRTQSNQKGSGHTFIMVDAGFCDLLRPALYGSYHHMEVVGRAAGRTPEPCVVAGPLCESGDVFTRDERELLDPRPLPRPEPGDLLVLHDAGAYGAAMSSNYVSMGKAPQVWWENGSASLISRRETLDDLLQVECDVAL